MKSPTVVSATEWTAAREQLLKKEKALTRQRDALVAERQALPWVEVAKSYTLEGPQGAATLAELFGDKSQLAVYHFMFGPSAEAGCPSCSLIAETFNGIVSHLGARDVAFAAVSRAPLAKLDAFRKRLGWSFPWYSSSASDFNLDFDASDDAGENPGLTVFAKGADGKIYRTYTLRDRGLEDLMSVYRYLDVVPKGRDEAGLPWGMAWVRHHDKY